MTREEAIKELQESLDTLREYDIAHSSRLKQALEMAIKALENYDTFMKYAYSYGKADALSQEPCEDAVSREAAITIVGTHTLTVDETVKALERLLSVTQKPNFCASCKHNTDNEICLECEYDGITRGMTRYESVMQKSGKWLITPMSNIAHCSECDYLFKDIPASVVEHFKYCPNCGCRMVATQEREEI